jgi:hypothetical protein
MAAQRKKREVIRSLSDLGSSQAVREMVDSEAAKLSAVERAQQLAARVRDQREAVVSRAKQYSETMRQRAEAEARTMAEAVESYTELLALSAELSKALGGTRPQTEADLDKALKIDDAESPVRVYAEVVALLQDLESRFPGVAERSAAKQAARRVLEYAGSLVEAVRRDLATNKSMERGLGGLNPYDVLNERLTAAIKLGLLEEVSEEPEKVQYVRGRKGQFFVARRFDLTDEVERELFARTKELLTGLRELLQECVVASVRTKEIREAAKADRQAEGEKRRLEREARIADLGTDAEAIGKFLRGDKGPIAGFVPGWKIRLGEQDSVITAYLEVSRDQSGNFVVADSSSTVFARMTDGKPIAKDSNAAKPIVKALHMMADALKSAKKTVHRPAALSDVVARFGEQPS